MTATFNVEICLQPQLLLTRSGLTPRWKMEWDRLAPSCAILRQSSQIDAHISASSINQRKPITRVTFVCLSLFVYGKLVAQDCLSACLSEKDCFCLPLLVGLFFGANGLHSDMHKCTATKRSICQSNNHSINNSFMNLLIHCINQSIHQSTENTIINKPGTQTKTTT